MDEEYRFPEDYLRRPYARVLTPDAESGTYTAEILEFPGCIAQGDTPEEAYGNLEGAAAGWVEAALNMEQRIPEPSDPYSYSGRIALRLPRGLHRRAAQMAERDGTSLNQFLVAAIAEQVGAGTLYAQATQRLAEQVAQTVVAPVQRVVANAVSGMVQNLAIRYLHTHDHTPARAGGFDFGGAITLNEGRHPAITSDRTIVASISELGG